MSKQISTRATPGLPKSPTVFIDLDEISGILLGLDLREMKSSHPSSAQ